MADQSIHTSGNGIATENDIPLINQKVELYSDEIQEIISHKPAFFVRYGIAFFFLVILSLLCSTFFIYYPDTVTAPVKISGSNTPKLLVSKVNGKLIELLISNEETVSEGQLIAFFESTAEHKQVLKLKNWIDETEYFITTGSLDVLLTNPLPTLTNLGEIQPSYQDFQNTLKQTLQTLENGFFQQKKAALIKDLEYIRLTRGIIDRQQELMQEEYRLQKGEYEINEHLANEDVIAQIDLSREKAKLLAKEQALEQIAANTVNNDLLLHNKHKELLEAEKSMADQKQSFQTAFLTLKSKVLEWVQQFTIVAPENGKLQYVSFLQENQMLSAGQELFYLIPEHGQFFAELAARQNNLGKIKINQDVVIKLVSYPYHEFGSLRGKVAYIPNVPLRDTVFLIKVSLPRGLTTTHNKTLLYKGALLGKAEIITDDQRLSDKILHQFLKLTER